MDTEEEQVEKLKAWLKENGMAIVMGIVIGVGGIGGYNYWVHHQQTVAAEASDHYMQMMQALEADNDEEVRARAAILQADYAATDYASLATLAMARMLVDNEDFSAAIDSLQPLVSSTEQTALVYIARVRVAALQIQLQQYPEALATLNAGFPDQFAALVDELRGDALALQGKTEEAILAYRKAQTAQPQPANPEFLRQKLNELGSRG